MVDGHHRPASEGLVSSSQPPKMFRLQNSIKEQFERYQEILETIKEVTM